MIPRLLQRVLAGESLSADEAQAAIEHMMRGEAGEAEIAGLLIALRSRGETVDEITGAARALRGGVLAVAPTRTDLVDTAGTGGDGQGTFNISTTAALIAAGAGAGVAKHGNRAASSRSGSADVLEALGVTISIPAERVADCIDEIGFGFLFAQAHHPAMRHVAPIRRALGVRTLFNLLGPLTNPAGARRQVVGVFDAGLVEPFARVLHLLGAECGLVVHGDGGIDELTPAGPCLIGWATPDGVRLETIDPLDLGIARSAAGALAGGSPAQNAAITESILAGEPGPPRDAAVLNAAAALVAVGRSADLAEGVAAAGAAIDDGRASHTLGRLRAFTAQAVPATEEAAT